MRNNDMTHCFGIIGAGMVADQHIESIMKIGNGTNRAYVKWVNARTEATVCAKKKKFDIPCGTTDYHDILNDVEVDCVVISTPPALHAEVFCEALAAGKNVLLEKPLCLTDTELEKMNACAQDYDELTVVECCARYAVLNNKFLFIKDMIDSGKLGKVYYIHHTQLHRKQRCGIEYNPGAYWFLDKSKAGGGPMMDWGEYDLAFHLCCLNNYQVPKLTNVDSFTINGLDVPPDGIPCFDVEEHGCALLKFENGMRYFWERGSNAHSETPGTTRICGTKGGLTFEFEPWASPTITYYSIDEEGRGDAIKTEYDVPARADISPEQWLVEHFLDVCDKKAENVMPFSRAAQLHRIVCEVLEKADVLNQ